MNGINYSEGRKGRKKEGGHKNIAISSLLKGVANNSEIERMGVMKNKLESVKQKHSPVLATMNCKYHETNYSNYGTFSTCTRLADKLTCN